MKLHPSLWPNWLFCTVLCVICTFLPLAVQGLFNLLYRLLHFCLAW